MVTPVPKSFFDSYEKMGINRNNKKIGAVKLE
jgi:hypothetical protein